MRRPQATKKKTLIVYLVLALICVLGYSFRASSQVTVKNIDRAAPVGARAAALGDSYIAEATDAGDLFGNPATLAFLSQPSVFMSHSIERKDEMMSENLALVFPSRKKKAFGFGVSVAHTGYVKDSPRAKTRMRIIQYLFSAGYAQSISASLGVGGSLGIRYVESGGYRLREITPAVGLFYNPSPEISYGLVYYDQGSPLQFKYDSSSSSWASEDPRRSLQIGIALRLHLWRKDPTLTVALANEKIFRVNDLTYKGGIEFQPISQLAFRLAYFVAPEVVYAKYGIGFNIRPLRIDYAISPSHLSDRLHEMTAVVSF